MTTAENKIKILSELWLDYRDDDSFSEFFDYNDVGLPLSYFIFSEIVLPSPRADIYISETFDMLLASLGLEDATGFESLEEMLIEAAQ